MVSEFEGSQSGRDGKALWTSALEVDMALDEAPEGYIFTASGLLLLRCVNFMGRPCATHICFYSSCSLRLGRLLTNNTAIVSILFIQK